MITTSRFGLLIVFVEITQVDFMSNIVGCSLFSATSIHNLESKAVLVASATYYVATFHIRSFLSP